ncbi:MAG: threonine synthase, partial [Geovibrio sp.]|nr:threonine synthase [Geovibrio sp.]
LATMRQVHEETGYILDPHSAVGVKAALEMGGEGQGPMICLATAHPAKFPDAVEKAINLRPALPDHLQGLMEREEKFDIISNDLNAIQACIRRAKL